MQHGPHASRAAFVRVGVGDEARAAIEVGGDQSLRGGAAGAGVAAKTAGLTLSEWVRDVLLGSSVEMGTLAAERTILAEVLGDWGT